MAMARRALAGLVLGVFATLLWLGWPDVKRYLKMARM
jgi:hypothetical protein